MTPAGFLSLAWQSVVAPQDVARLLISLRLSREALLTAFALVVILNTLTFSLSLLATPPETEALRPVMNSPVLFLFLLSASLAIVIFAITWTGQALGGTARVEDIAILVIWLQALRVIVQGAMVLLVPLSAALAGLVVMAASVLGVWILVNFTEAAHEFGSLMKAALVLILAVTGMVLGLSLLFTLSGVTMTGMT